MDKYRLTVLADYLEKAACWKRFDREERERY